MQIELPDDRNLQAQALAAGYSSVQEYVTMLIDRDADRIAIQQGIDDMNAGRMKSWEEVDADIRKDFGFPPRTSTN